MIRLERRQVWQAAIVLLAALLLVVPLPSRLVESGYSARVYPTIQWLLTTVSNRFAVSLLDVALIGVVISWFVATARALVSSRGTDLGRRLCTAAASTVTLVAGAYIAFMLLWGLNYRRVPLETKVRFRAEQVSLNAAIALASESVDELNRLYAPAHRGRLEAVEPHGELAQAFERTQRALGVRQPAIPGRPKRSLLDLYFRSAGIAGMTDPYFLETLIASDLLDVERPFVVAHEWSHLAGITDEGEANFVGWLTCLRGMESHRYSGWLFLYSEVTQALTWDDIRNIRARLAEGPRSDLAAIRQRLLRNISPRVSAVGWRVYDQYLKANRVEQGAASYGQVVRLILGTKFDSERMPILR